MIPGVVVEIHAFATHDEHQIRHGAQNRAVSHLAAAKRVFGLLPVGDVPPDAQEFSHASVRTRHPLGDPLVAPDIPFFRRHLAFDTSDVGWSGQRRQMRREAFAHAVR